MSPFLLFLLSKLKFFIHFHGALKEFRKFIFSLHPYPFQATFNNTVVQFFTASELLYYSPMQRFNSKTSRHRNVKIFTYHHRIIVSHSLTRLNYHSLYVSQTLNFVSMWPTMLMMLNWPALKEEEWLRMSVWVTQANNICQTVAYLGH